MKIGYGKNIEELEKAGCKILYRTNEFAAMMDLIKPGDVLVVYSLTDISEHLPEFLEIAGNLKDRGVGFISLRDDVDTTEYRGVMLYNLLGALAGLKLELKRGAGRKPSIDRIAFEKDVRAGMSYSALGAKYGIAPVSVWRNKKAILG
jgi:hypothetical protein